MLNLKKFSIICNIDGKILSFNNKCENFFNLSKQNVINIERIYNLINSDFVMYFIDNFNFFKNNDVFFHKIDIMLINSIQTSIVFRKKFNSKFIIIDFFDCVSNLNKPKKSFFDVFNLIVRSKFTLGSILPFFFSFFLVINDFDNYSIFITVILFFSLYFFHVSANTFNDYFDWKSGRDKLNVDYVLFSTGGSRTIDLKIISEKKMLFFAISSLFIVFLLSTIIIYLRGLLIFYLGLIGFLCVYFYSAPPIHLASRYGLGELMHIICLGPLITYGCTYALIGFSSINNLIIGIPFGLLITCCLLLNEVPDSKFDKISKKFNLVVVLGIKRIPFLFLFLCLLAFFITLVYAIFFDFLFFIFILVIVPYLVNGFRNMINISNDIKAINESCVFSFYIYLYFSLILIFAMFLNTLIFFYPW